MRKSIAAVIVWLLSWGWLFFGVVELLVWSGLRHDIFGKTAMVEMLASVLADLLWLPIAFLLPFYLYAELRRLIKGKMVRFLTIFALLFLLFLLLVNPAFVFRWLFLPSFLFLFLLGRRIYLDRRLRWDKVLYGVCLLILIGYYGPQLLPHLAIERKSPTLSAISYNISVSQPKPMRQQFIDQVLRLSPDVIFVQEINSRDRNLLRDKLSEAYPHQLWSDRSATYNNGAILSRLPFEQSENVNIYTPYMRSHTNVNYAAVTLAGQPVHLFNCHLYPSGHSFIRFLFGRMETDAFVHETRIAYKRRLEEAEQIHRLIEVLPGSVVLAGDLNDSPNSQIYQLFANKLRNGFRQAGWGLGSTFGEYRLAEQLPARLRFLANDFLRIDHIFCSPDLQVYSARVLQIDDSDHKPQIVKIRPAKE